MAKKPKKKPRIVQIGTQIDLARALGWNRECLRVRMRDASWPVSDTPPWSQSDLVAVGVWADRKFATATDPDPNLSGPISEGLERYRVAKASLAELELAREKRETIRISDALEAFATICLCLREASKLIGREYGREAQRIIDEALTEADRLVAEKFPKDAANA